MDKMKVVSLIIIFIYCAFVICYTILRALYSVLTITHAVNTLMLGSYIFYNHMKGKQWEY